MKSFIALLCILFASSAFAQQNTGTPLLPTQGPAYTTPFVVPGVGATVYTNPSVRAARNPDAKADYGAICNGSSHLLSSTFGTLVAAQAVYPSAIALSDETDWAAITQDISQWRSRTTGFGINSRLDLTNLGACVINRTLDLSNIRSHGIVLAFGGTYFICNTVGVICVDGSMNEFSTWDHLSLNGQQANAPNIGFFVGRNATNNRADNNKYIGLEAVGYFTVAAVDNFGGEVNSWDHPIIANIAPNAYGFIGDGCNHFGIAGAQGNTAPLDNPVSFYQGEYVSGEITTSGANSAPVWLCHTYSHHFDNTYTVWAGTVSPLTNYLLWSNTPPNATVTSTSVSYDNVTGILSMTFATPPFNATFVGTGAVVNIVSTAGTNATQLNGHFPITSITSAGTVISVQATSGLLASGLSGSVIASGTGDETKELYVAAHTEGGATGELGMFGFAGPNTAQTITKLTYRDAGYGARTNDFYAASGIVSVTLPGLNFSGGNVHNGEFVFDQPSIYHVTGGWIDLGDETDPARWNLSTTNWSGCLLVSGSNTKCNNLAGFFQPYGMPTSLGAGGQINVLTAGSLSALAVATQAGYGANTSGTYSFPTITISPPDVTGGTQATAHVSGWGLYAAPVSGGGGGSWVPGGTGYSVNDVLTLPGGTCSVQPQIKVLTVDGSGSALTWQKQTVGVCTVAMSMPVSLTGGTGTTATLSRVAWTPLTVAVDNGGTGYLTPTLTFSDVVFNALNAPTVTPTVSSATLNVAGAITSASTIIPTNNDTFYYALLPVPATTSAAAPSQNLARCTAFSLNAPEHIDQLSINVTTLGTGPLNVALYTDAIDATTHRHQPQINLWSGSFVVTSTGSPTAAVGTGGTGIAFPAGLSWYCTNDTNAADAVRMAVVAGTNTYEANLIGSATVGIITSASANISSLIITEPAGTWPSFVGSSFVDSAGVIVPLIAARIASQP